MSHDEGSISEQGVQVQNGMPPTAAAGAADTSVTTGEVDTSVRWQKLVECHENITATYSSVHA